MGELENKIAFYIPSYERLNSLTEIVKRIHQYGDVYVMQDGGRQDYSSLKEYGVKLFRNKFHLGKKRFYLTVTTLMSFVWDKDYKYHFFLPDDLIPVDGFVEKAIDTWDCIVDRRKICLNLFLEESRFGKPCWTNFPPINKGNVYLTQWVDMCFICEDQFFDQLGYSIPMIHRDWNGSPELGSGVGSYISKRLFSRRFNMYQVKKSLLIPSEEAFKSKMNPGQGNDSIHKAIL